jgi:hypothetical protein
MNEAAAAADRSPVDPPWHIAAVAATVLILELALIRQVPAEVRAISYFTNLILLASFFGLGLGCILQQRRSLSWMLPAGLVLIFGFISVGRGVVIYPGSEEVHFWLESAATPGQALRLPILPAAVAIFLFTGLAFVALGQTLARKMDQHPRLVAYSWDIAGSLSGTILFAVSSLIHLPPWVWPPVLLGLWAALFVASRAWRWISALTGALFLLFAASPLEWSWSPYYFIQHQRSQLGTRVWVNSSFHQFAIDFTSEDPEHRAAQAEMVKKWKRPYDLYRQLHGGRSPAEVLVLGAGTGNDVNMALWEGAEKVVAVEIDPVILALGVELNGTDPYGDPRVRRRVDDARHFLRTSGERFDLIVFGTLDSQVLLSGHSNLRLENYVYTRESLLDARRLLADGGMAAVFYAVHKPWLYGRIYTTFREAFGDQSRIFLDRHQALFNTTIVGTRDFEKFGDRPEVVELFGHGIPSTDDWPFIYLERPTIAPVYGALLAIIALLIGGVFLLLRRIHPVTGLYANFLFLGLGFTLMESSAIVRLALVFGSTWTVNATVFASVLATIFVANRMVLRGSAPPEGVAWVGLCCFVLVNYFFPVSLLFRVGPALRVLSCGLLIGLPVYFAAVCFSHLFRRQRITGYPLGVNLIGAMGGGLIEYASMVIGMRQVWMIVLVIYLLAWLSTSLIERRG